MVNVVSARVGKSSFRSHQAGIINGYEIQRIFLNENQDIYVVLKCFLTGCLFVSRESKNQQLYSGEIGQHLDREIKIVITSERQMDVRDLQM